MSQINSKWLKVLEVLVAPATNSFLHFHTLNLQIMIRMHTYVY